MAPQVLFYEQAAPVSSERHGDLAVQGIASYSFARQVNAVPVVAPEVATASTDYAIVFIGRDDDVLPAALLGLRDGENHFIAEDGSWDSSYIPAFVRRYPFVFAQQGEEAGRLVLCIDEASPMLNREGRGERLFDSTGARTTYLDNVLSFMQRYQNAYQQTQQFARKLKALELLQPVQANVRTPGGDVQIRGFQTVNRDKLAALEAAAVDELFRSGALEIIHLHLASMRNIEKLAKRAGASAATTASSSGVGDSLNEGDILLN